MCHKIGYYLQKLHKLDLVRMKVDFHVDEWGKVYLFGVTDLLVRKDRHVPTENDGLLAEYIFKKITARENLRKLKVAQMKHEEQKRLEKENKAANRQSVPLLGSNTTWGKASLTPNQTNYDPYKSVASIKDDPSSFMQDLRAMHPVNRNKLISTSTSKL